LNPFLKAPGLKENDMAFCSTCGTQNPDQAKFCAKCGQPLAAAAAARPEPPQAQVTAREALSSPPVPRPSGPFSRDPDPNAPNQTQFFMAAAGVSTASKAKRALVFILIAGLVAALIWAFVYYGIMQKEDPAAKLKRQKAATVQTEAPAEPGVPAPPAAGDQPGAEPQPAVQPQPAAQPQPASNTPKSPAKTPRKRSR
jgi:hypothetical protein